MLQILQNVNERGKQLVSKLEALKFKYSDQIADIRGKVCYG